MRQEFRTERSNNFYKYNLSLNYMKNKFIITLFVLLIGVSLFSGIVSAQYYSGFGTENLIDSLTNVL